jgi:hypothetical protein
VVTIIGVSSAQIFFTNLVVANAWPRYHQSGYIKVQRSAEQKADNGVAYWP